MPESISPTTAKKLAKSAETICDLVDGGMQPIDAAVKVARDHGLTSGQVDLVCRAYNAGAVTSQREAYEDFSDKVAAADIVDADKVKDAVFPSVLKLASVDTVSPIYSRRYESNKKVASAKPENLVKRAQDMATCSCGCGGKGTCLELEKVKVVKDNRVKAREKLAELRQVTREVEVLENKASAAVANLVDQARLMDPRDRVAKLAYYRQYASANYGELGEMLIDKAAEAHLNTLETDKYVELQSVAQKQAAALNFGLHKHIDNTCEAIQKLAEAEVEWPVKILQIRHEIQQLAPETVKQASISELKLEGQDDKAVADAELAKFADIGSMLGLGGGAPAPSGGNDTAERELMLQLMNPAHEAKLKGIRAQSMLHELAKQDDIVSSYTPQEIASAFNELSQSAPKIIGNPTLLRANMRRMLQGNLSPFEAKEILASQQYLNQPQPGRPQ